MLNTARSPKDHQGVLPRLQHFGLRVPGARLPEGVMIELRKRGLIVQPKAPIKVYYDSQEVGEYFADILVENCVIVELKAVEALAEKHDAQTLNYLKASNLEVGLLINFGPKPEFNARSMKPPVSCPQRKVAHRPHSCHPADFGCHDWL